MALQMAVPGLAGQLVGQSAPQRSDRLSLTGRAVNFQPLLHVEFVAREQRDPGPRQFRQSGEGHKFPHRAVIGQNCAPFGQVEQRNQGVGFTPAVGYLQAQDRPARLTGQPPQHIAGQHLHAVGGIGAVKEHARFAIDGRGRAGAHVIQVGGKFIQAERVAAHVSAEGTELMPGVGSHRITPCQKR
jgi:hypothetical protein